MTQPRKIDSCIVVGAGISGLLAAGSLKDQGVRVIILEKSLGVGGRLATRRIDDATFDHGAQYFTVRNHVFAELINQWQSDGVVRKWASAANHEEHEFARFCGSQGMTTLAKHLARNITVRRGARVRELKQAGNQWHLKIDDGAMLVAQAVILTPPLPQSLALLDNSNIEVPEPERRQLESVDYDPCIAVLALLEGSSGVPPPGALELPSEPIQWIADNHIKGISQKAGALTIHGSHQFTREYWDRDPLETGEHLIDAANNWIGGKVRTFQTHHWRYSRPVNLFPAICFSIDSPAPLLLAGDAFGGPRVEAAALSGLAAAKHLLIGQTIPPDLLGRSLADRKQ